MLAPRVRVVRCAPKTHPCPTCGKRGRRKRTLRRRIRSLAYRQEADLDVHSAEYRSRCGCRQSSLPATAGNLAEGRFSIPRHDTSAEEYFGGQWWKIERVERRIVLLKIGIWRAFGSLGKVFHVFFLRVVFLLCSVRRQNLIDQRCLPS